MKAGAPKGNKNAEIWDFETAENFMIKAVELSRNTDYDFIGEVAFDLEQDKGVFDYLCEKFPQLNTLKTKIKANCEVNCFRNSKKGKIREATAIINLKANHNWKDRADVTTNDKEINIPPTYWLNEPTKNTPEI